MLSRIFPLTLYFCNPLFYAIFVWHFVILSPPSSIVFAMQPLILSSLLWQTLRFWSVGVSVEQPPKIRIPNAIKTNIFIVSPFLWLYFVFIVLLDKRTKVLKDSRILSFFKSWKIKRRVLNHSLSWGMVCICIEETFNIVQKLSY